MKSRLSFLSVSQSPSHTQALSLSLSVSRSLSLSLSLALSLSRVGVRSLSPSLLESTDGVFKCPFWMVEFTQKKRRKNRELPAVVNYGGRNKSSA